MKLTFLGTGTSVGTPFPGCLCPVCQSDDPRDRRLRVSALVETDGLRILIDCGPDIRQQLLGQPYDRIDAVLLTHEHYDHIGGVDDLRPYCHFGEIPLYADNRTANALRRTMPYCFTDHPYPGAPKLRINEIEAGNDFMVGGVRIVPLRVMHGPTPILSYRIGKLGFVTDMKTAPEATYAGLEGVEVLVVNALRFEREHFSHQLVDDAVAFSEAVHARDTYIIHTNHDVGLQKEIEKKVPEHVHFAYDGQVLNF